MTDSTTATLRLTEPTVGGDSGTWGTITNNDWTYVDEAANQSVTVNIPDTNISLTADGSGSDQARYLRYNFTGSLSVDRTVTIPSNQKVGWASNNTSGGNNVILSAGGTTLSILNNSWTFFQCDGTNVTAPPVAIGGTTTNDNAVAGTVGEYVSAELAFGSPVTLTSTVSANLTSISLSAGDWDVSGTVGFGISGTTTVVAGGASTTSATFTADKADMSFFELFIPSGVAQSTKGLFGPIRFSFSGTTTVYLMALAIFSSGSTSAYGSIRARRIR